MSLTPKILSFAVLMAIGGAAAAANTGGSAADRALGLIQGHGAAVRASSADQFVVRSVSTDASGTEHVRFDRTYRGLPVIGGDMVIHSRGGEFKGVSQTLRTASRPEISPRVGSDEAILRAGTAFGSDFQGMPTSRLVIFARGASPLLAHEVVYAGVKADQTPTEMHYFVDARSGRILDKWDMVHTAGANGTANTLFSGQVTIGTNSLATGFEMRDTTRGNSYTSDFKNGATSKPGAGTIFTDADNTWGNGATSDRATAGADAHFGVASTWDFYKNVLGRTGIAGNGVGSYSRVHVGKNYVNAFWSDSCFCMSYGDGDGVTYAPLVTLDIAGHEMSHGVTSKAAGLAYSGESGGLNEATSDIMGTMVEFYAARPSDPADYLIGEKIYKQFPAGNKALRYMYNPIADTRSPNCYTSTLGSLDVHYSSGVANRFFYLLAEGSAAKLFNGISHYATTCNGGSVTGLGRDAAAKIWYRALDVYMTSNTNYAGARAATLSAAADLGYSTSEVTAAWAAVNVN